MKTKPSISIFFPFLNDWGTVGSLVGLAIATVEKLTDDWEVIIVNDGSIKEYREALQLIVETINSNSKFKIKNEKLSPQQRDPAEAGQFKIKNYQKAIKTPRGWQAEAQAEAMTPPMVEESRIRIINHEKNRGYGGALRSGFAAATKDLIFYTDCDAQYDPRELVKLYKALKPDVDMVNGYKIKRNDPLHRIVAGRIYHYLVKFAFGLPIRDTDCDFRLIRRKVFDSSAGASTELSRMSSGQGKVKLFENTGTICVELVKKADHHGFKIIEVPVHHYWRTSGKSQFFNFGRLTKTGINLLKLWWKLMVRKDYYG